MTPLEEIAHQPEMSCPLPNSPNTFCVDSKDRSECQVKRDFSGQQLLINKDTFDSTINELMLNV